MAKKINTYSLKQFLTSKVGLLVLFIVCNVSLYANEGKYLMSGADSFILNLTNIESVDYHGDYQLLKNTYPNLNENRRVELSEAVFKKAKYYFEGFGNKEVIGLRSDDSDKVVIDALVKPRSIRKRCSIAEQTDGQYGYRLLQDGRDVIFEIAIAGSLHKVTASDVLERGESIYLSAYYKNGDVGILVNGKVPVKEVFQINSDKIVNLKNLGVESAIVNHLSGLEDEVFYMPSDFKKTLRKQIGRRAYKRYGDEIVQVAYGNIEQASSHCSVFGEISFADVPLVVGSDFSGVVEQIRIWQPASATCTVTIDPEDGQEYQARLSSEEKKRVDLSLNTEVIVKSQKLPVQHIEPTLIQVKCLTCLHNIGCQLTSPVAKACSTSIALAETNSTYYQNCQPSFNQKTIDKVLATSSIVSNHRYLTRGWDSSVDLDECFSLKAKRVNNQSFQIQYGILNYVSERQVSTFLGEKKYGGLADGVKAWNSEAVNYDNLIIGAYQQNFLADNTLFEGKELKFTFANNNQFTNDVKRLELFDAVKLRWKKKFPFFINDQVSYTLDGNNSSTGRSSKIYENEKLKRSTEDVNSEWVSALKGCFKKSHESIKCKSPVEICPGDVVNYVSYNPAFINWVSVRQPVHLILRMTRYDDCKIQEGPNVGLLTGAGFMDIKRSTGFDLDYHNCTDFLTFLENDRSSGCENSNLRLVCNQVILGKKYLKTSSLHGDDLKRLIQDFGITLPLAKVLPVLQTDNCLFDSEMNWGNKKWADRGGGTVGVIYSSDFSNFDDVAISLFRSDFVMFVSRDKHNIEPFPPPEWWQHNSST